MLYKGCLYRERFFRENTFISGDFLCGTCFGLDLSAADNMITYYFRTLLSLLSFPRGYFLIWLVIWITGGTSLHAEILVRSRPDPELKERIHRILQKSMQQEYVDVSVFQHSLLSTEAVARKLNIVPGVSIASKKSESNLLFRYRTIVLTVNRAVDLDQVEARVRSELEELEPQDRFEQSVMIEKVEVIRRDFSQRLVEYVDLLVRARQDLDQNRTDSEREKLKVAAEISAEFPAGYEMIGIDQLITRDLARTGEGFTFMEWILVSLLALLLLALLGGLYFYSKSESKEESMQHPLQGSLDKVVSAIEGMAPEETEKEDEIDRDVLEESTEGEEDEKIDYFGFVRRMPLEKQVALMQKLPPQYQAMVFTQLGAEDVAKLLKALPRQEALAAVLSLKEVEVSPSQLQQLSEKLNDASAKLPVTFDGLVRIAELSGQMNSQTWEEILDSGDGLATKNPELAGRAEKNLREIRARSISFDILHTRKEIDAPLVSRVMERFERSRLSTGARVSVPYILLDAETDIQDMILSEYTDETRKYYQEQLEQLNKQREEDEDARSRIERTRDQHRGLFMRHVHLEVSKGMATHQLWQTLQR